MKNLKIDESTGLVLEGGECAEYLLAACLIILWIMISGFLMR